jgi:sugar lactone lactonase YvrE
MDTGTELTMSGNRFEFLEFEDEGGTAAQREATEHAEFGYGPALVPFGQRSHDGLALSEVARPEKDPERGMPTTYLLQTLPDETAELAPRPEPEKYLSVVDVFGDRGQRAGQFNFPTGLAVDNRGILFVADSYNHRIQRITPDHGVSAIGARGSSRGEFLSPQDIATDGDCAFYVVEQGNHRIQKFSADGVIELVLGRYGGRPGEFKGPMSVAVASSGDIFVADTGNGRVQRFDSEGRYIGLVGEPSGSFLGLSSPQSLVVDAGDNLYIADTFSGKVLRFDPGGRYVGHYSGSVDPGGSRKKPRSAFNEPRALAVDTSGLLYVADLTEARTYDIEPPGRLRMVDTETGETRSVLEHVGHGLGLLARPCGLAVTIDVQKDIKDKKPAASLYAADTANHRILRFVWN